MLHVCNKAFTIPQEGKFLFKPNTCLNCNSRAKTEMTERAPTGLGFRGHTMSRLRIPPIPLVHKCNKYLGLEQNKTKTAQKSCVYLLSSFFLPTLSNPGQHSFHPHETKWLTARTQAISTLPESMIKPPCHCTQLSYI